MKKLFVLIALCMATAAQATILRVSNVTNSGAPYTNIPAAIEAAQEGDTIMVDGSPDPYTDSSPMVASLDINKRLVLMGPGYFLTQNGVRKDGASTAIIDTEIDVLEAAAGTVIQGFTFNLAIEVYAPNTIITRCKLDGTLNISQTATNVVIHQNFCSSFIVGGSATDNSASNTQITNNIFTHSTGLEAGVVRYFKNAYFAYNTFTQYYNQSFYYPIRNFESSTIENNVFFGNEKNFATCTFNNNYWGSPSNNPYGSLTTDKQMAEVALSNELATAFADKGAFKGDDPYVISGVPAGPIIQDIIVPTSVEKGKALNVTIKLGIQK